MVYQRKSVAVLVLKLPNGNYKVTDIYGKIEELSPEDFNKYIEMKVTEAPAAAVNVKQIAEEVTNAILNSDTDYALDLLQRLL